MEHLWEMEIERLFRWNLPLFVLLFEQVDEQLPPEALSEPRGRLALWVWRWSWGRGGNDGGYRPQSDTRPGLGSHYLFGVLLVSGHVDSHANSLVLSDLIHMRMRPWIHVHTPDNANVRLWGSSVYCYSSSNTKSSLWIESFTPKVNKKWDF